MGLICGACMQAHSQSAKYQFGRLDMNKGLSHPTVYDIYQDSTGFIWFATASGLNRFDGYSIKVFRNNPGDSTSLHVDLLNRIFEGPEGKLWFTSHAGNIAYNPKTESFIRNTDGLLRKYGVAHGVITFLKKDKFGRFWFVHYNQGLFCYNPVTRKTTKMIPVDGDTTSISTVQISSLTEDSEGNIWLIHQNGIFEKIDRQSLTVTYRNMVMHNKFKGQTLEYNLFVDSDGDIWVYNHLDDGCFFIDFKSNEVTQLYTRSRSKLSSDIVSHILQDNNRLIWIGTENGGINILDKTDFSVRSFLNDENDPKSLAENTIRAMYKDRQGIFWFGSYRSGVSYYHPDIFRFQLIKHEVSHPQSLPYNDLNAFAEDKAGNIWIGTNGGGLIYFDRKKNTFTQYLNNPGNPNSLSNNVVVSLLVDHENILWIGTYYGGLNRFDGKQFTRYVNSPANPKSLSDNSVWEIQEDSNYNLWIGTLRGGLDYYNIEKNEFIHYRSGEINSIHTPYVPAVMEDKAGNIWVATGFGLEVLQKNTGRFVQYLNSLDKPTSISSNSLQCVFEDSRGWIWIGTNGGLNRYNPTSDDFIIFREQDGLAHNSILTLTEDKDRNLWMSTPKGLTKFSFAKDTNQATIQNYYASDGLVQGVFHEKAVLRCTSGELIFGGSAGFNIFNPSQIVTDKSSVAVVFTDLQVSNQSVVTGKEVNGEIILPLPINEVKHITLGPNYNFFSLEFAALNYLHPDKSQYQYRLDGFNDKWITTNTNQRSVTFTNLDPGDYTFRVRATNSDGIWGKNEAQLKITILPPFWKSKIAFLLYAAIILGALLIGRRLVVARERLKFSIQSERNHAKKVHELDLMKIRFFTNVSHELRTPLTLIITPLEKLLKNVKSPDEEKQYNLIYRNARRLLNLVNQLLDFKRMENDELNLNMSEGDIVQFIRDLVWSFSDLSDKKNIRLTFNSSVPSQETFFDKDKVEKIIVNLLSNAFKFTHDYGHVSVDLDWVEENHTKFLLIKVSDTGIGIPSDKKERIFDRFYQHELPPNMVNQGSGIGLSITQEFVKLHGGSIDVESQVGKGSTFIVKLTLYDIHTPPVIDDIDSLLSTDDGEPGTDLNDGATKPMLMLVEDNEDFRAYLKENLKQHYTIVEAANGQLAFEKAISIVPDLIVSDIMMPGWDGVELCKRIKADNRTSHIPVILLTAKTAHEHELEGFQSGANDYITKPFSFDVLETRIQNLLNLRNQSHKQFQKHLDIKVSDIEVASVDEKLIQNAVKLVEENMGNSDFSVEELSRMLAMSRVHLYKKLFSLTGKTPIEFIRFIRIQRAAQLLAKSNLTVSEVAYQVGFNHPKYFARYFRDVYNMLPSQYVSQNRQSKANAPKDL